MKKLIASLLVLVFGATMVMAENANPIVAEDSILIDGTIFSDVEGYVLDKNVTPLISGSQGNWDVGVRIEIKTPIGKAELSAHYDNRKDSNNKNSSNKIDKGERAGGGRLTK